MKRFLLALGLVAFMMTSCCDKQENKENCEQKECCKDKKEQCEKHQHECDHHEMPGMPGMCPEMMAATDKVLEAVANWDNLAEEQRTEIITMAKSLMEKKDAMKAEMEKLGKCEGKHEGCQHQHEGCEHAEK